MIFCAALLLGSLSAEATSSAYVVAQASSRAHRHLRLGDVKEQVLPDVEIDEITFDKSVTKENLARSLDGRYEAFTSYHPDQFPSFSIYFVERGTGKGYEVRGLPLPHRPFSDLVWVNNRTLVFDRWSQPHYGIHYVVNVRRKKLVRASAFPDEFYLEQQRPKARRKKEQSPSARERSPTMACS
jgi:hypothetical protein